MATIAIHGMHFYAHHGCFAEERMIGTHFRVDLSFVVDTAVAERTDCIADTVSYLDVYQTVKAQMERPSNLLEHVARRVVDAVMERYSCIDSVKAVVHKLNPPLGGQMDSVSVEVEAKR